MKRTELVNTLELVKPALAKNNMVPIFQCFMFGMGMVEAYDDQVAMCGPCDIESEFALHGNTLLGLLSNSSTEEVSIDLKGDTATLTMGKAVSKLPYQPKENFIFEAPIVDVRGGIPFTESLAEALELCLESVSTDTTQTALLGVTVLGNKLYSCNGDSLTRVQIKQGFKERVLLPTAFCEAVLKLWRSLEMTKGTLAFDKDWVFADFGDWNVYGRVLEITSPIDFEELIKRNVKGKIKTCPLPQELAGALSRARVLSDPESQKTVVSVCKGKASLVTETHMGETSDTISFDKNHPDVVANVNAMHLSRAIKNAETIAFLENCTILEKPDVLQLVSNMS